MQKLEAHLNSPNVDVNKKYQDQYPLILAATYDNLPLLKKIISKGANINVVNEKQKNALQIALANKNENIAQHLIDKNINVDQLDALKSTSLFYSIKYRKYEIFKQILSKTKLINQPNINKETALHYSLKYKEDEMFDEILKVQNINLNLKDLEKDTPLLKAIKNQYPKFAIKLINAGADYEVKDTDNSTAILLALKYNQPDVYNPLLTMGCKLDVINNKKQSALSYAVVNQLEDIVGRLLIEDIDVNLMNTSSKTPLFVAIESNQFEIVKKLLQKGANPNLSEKDNIPIIQAFKTQNYYLVELLIIKGAVLDIQNQAGENLFQILVKEENSSDQLYMFYMLKELDQKYFDSKLNEKNNLDQTVLISSIINRKFVLAEFLMENGADFTVIDKENRTFIEYGRELPGDLFYVLRNAVNEKNRYQISEFMNTVSYRRLDRFADSEPYIKYLLSLIQEYLQIVQKCDYTLIAKLAGKIFDAQKLDNVQSSDEINLMLNNMFKLINEKHHQTAKDIVDQGFYQFFNVNNNSEINDQINQIVEEIRLEQEENAKTNSEIITI